MVGNEGRPRSRRCLHGTRGNPHDDIISSMKEVRRNVVEARYVAAHVSANSPVRAQRGPVAHRRRVRRRPPAVRAGPDTAAQPALHVNRGRPRSPLAVDHVADAAPRGQRRTAHDRQLRAGPHRCRPAPSTGLAAAARGRCLGRHLRHPAQLPGAGGRRELQLLPAGHFRRRADGIPGGVGDIPGVQPDHGPRVVPQRRHVDPPCGGAQAPSQRAEARDQGGHWPLWPHSWSPNGASRG